MWLSVTENFIPEVFIVCNQDPVFRKGFLDDFFIINSPRLFKDRKHFMIMFAEPLCHPWTCRLIYEKSHYASVANGIKTVVSSDFVANRIQARTSSTFNP